MPWLELYEQKALKIKVSLQDTPILLGRDQKCDLRINDRAVSRTQAEIHPAGTGYELRNLSDNGTRVNAELVHGTQPLVFGDRIYLGHDFAVIFLPDGFGQDSMADAPTERVTLDLIRQAKDLRQ